MVRCIIFRVASSWIAGTPSLDSGPPTVGLLGLHFSELPAVGLPELCRKRIEGRKHGRAECERKARKEIMPERREEDMEEARPIPLRNVIPALPIDDRHVKELKEDLRAMGCHWSPLPPLEPPGGRCAERISFRKRQSV